VLRPAAEGGGPRPPPRQEGAVANCTLLFVQAQESTIGASFFTKAIPEKHVKFEIWCAALCILLPATPCQQVRQWRTALPAQCRCHASAKDIPLADSPLLLHAARRVPCAFSLAGAHTLCTHLPHRSDLTLRLSLPTHVIQISAAASHLKRLQLRPAGTPRDRSGTTPSPRCTTAAPPPPLWCMM
jgi:hypothetical protein